MGWLCCLTNQNESEATLYGREPFGTRYCEGQAGIQPSAISRNAQTFVRLGLIDEYVLMVHPVAIGNRKRVFTGRVDLELISAKTYKSGVMSVGYRPFNIGMEG
jgi:hypothetical protein